MANITDFEAWLSQFDFTEEDYEDICSLYSSVHEVGEMGIFKTEPAKGQNMWIVSSLTSDDQLLLASEAARNYLLKFLTAKYCGDLDMESWYGFKHAMSKND